MIYPITFCIPENKIYEKIIKKEKIYSTIIPGNINTYIFNDEGHYREDYAKSVFGLTKKKGGWDCLRHYEIMASGSIPYFQDLKDCPQNTMTHLPKELILEAMHECNDEMDPNSEKIIYYSNKILEYTKEHLTTKAMAKYIVNKMNMQNAKKILYLSGDTSPDYMRCLLLHGFKELYQKDCHDSPCIPHLYTDISEEHAKALYGKGFTYTRLLDKNANRTNDYDNSIENDIASHNYDLIIYGSCHRGMPYWNLVNTYYKKDEIALVCGEDLHHCDLKEVYNNYNMFIREL